MCDRLGIWCCELTCLLCPTENRLVAGKIPFTAYVICLVEFAERASYYGLVFFLPMSCPYRLLTLTSFFSCSGIFNNFIQSVRL